MFSLMIWERRVRNRQNSAAFIWFLCHIFITLIKLLLLQSLQSEFVISHHG